MLEYMTSEYPYFWSKWYTFVQAMTPLHSRAANDLKSMTEPHWLVSIDSCGWDQKKRNDFSFLPIVLCPMSKNLIGATSAI